MGRFQRYTIQLISILEGEERIEQKKILKVTMLEVFLKLIIEIKPQILDTQRTPRRINTPIRTHL